MPKSDSQKEPLPTLPPSPPSSPPVMQPWPARTNQPMHLANALVGTAIVVTLLITLPFSWHDPSKRFACLATVAFVLLLTLWKWFCTFRFSDKTDKL